MRCYECGVPYIEKHGSLALHSEIVGNYSVYNVDYFECESCGARLYPKDTAKKIEAAEQHKLVELVAKIPAGNLVSSIEAADFLGISRQAFHKHRKIKNGFVYSIVLGGNKFFDKKSLRLYKETGDGRYKLHDEQAYAKKKYKALPVTDMESEYKELMQASSANKQQRWHAKNSPGRFSHFIKCYSAPVTVVKEIETTDCITPSLFDETKQHFVGIPK